MDEIADFSDERLKAWCVHCGRFLVDVKKTKDHVPTKSLLREPYPGNLPVVLVCVECNHGFSRHEQYLVAFLSSVLAGTTDPAMQSLPAAERILKHNRELRAEIEKSKFEHKTLFGETDLVWEPKNESVECVVVKNARGHAFYEFGEPMLDKPESVSLRPLEAMSPSEREDFEDVPSSGLLPEVGSRMLTRVLTGRDLDGPWVIVQEGVYRYSVAQYGGGMLVRSVMWEYLATEVYWD